MQIYQHRFYEDYGPTGQANLCAYEQAYAETDAETCAEVVLGPEVVRHLFHYGPVGLALLLGGLINRRKGVFVLFGVGLVGFGIGAEAGGGLVSVGGWQPIQGARPRPSEETLGGRKNTG